MPVPAGTRLGRYEIRSQIGAGGMGEVYLAQDTQLRRPVALKLLPPDFVKNSDRLRRFEQEAYAASALNHPNIITIYEVGQTEESSFIATEFIDGVTLRDYMTRERIKLSEVLELMIQVASALAAAHEAGIIHRDIKPENIMVRRDGYAKVLDFGLAKLNERRAFPSDPEAQTMMRDITEPGVIMGTARYMSPEQARALAVDARTDIWSLGAVLYEMLTGRTPFEGPTYSHVIVAIIEEEPPPIKTLAPIVPQALERVVMKALAKDPAARYQTAKEFGNELRQLKNRMDFEAELELSIQPNQATVLLSKSEQRIFTGQALANPTEKITAAHSTLNTDSFSGKLRASSRPFLIAWLVAAIVTLAGIAFGVRHLFFNSSQSPAFQTVSLTRLTTTGKATDATISPDGKYVVHVVADGGQQSLWIRHVVTASNVQIVPPAEVQFRGLTFSPDGDFIYYVVRERSTPEGALYQVPVLGGTPKKIVTGIDRQITFSPDGKQFAFISRDYPQPGMRALMVAQINGRDKKQIPASQLPNDFWSPAWSPDGQMIACAAVHQDNGLYVSVMGVRVSDGAVTPLTSERWFDVGRVVWLADGSGLLVTATAQWSGFSNQIEYISYPGGQTHKITNDLNNYSGLGLTKDSGALVTVQSEHRSSIWSVAPHSNAATQITSGINKYDGVYDLSWTPDGRIVYESTASGDEDIWMMDADGNNQKQLTVKAGINLFPSVTPDGKYIVFTSTRADGNTNIWRMNIDGTDPKQLTGGHIDNFPTASSDSRWVVYMSNVSGQRSIWKVSIDGGQPVQLVTSQSSRPVVSAQDNLIAAYYIDAAANSPLKVVTIPFSGGQPLKTFEIPITAFSAIPPPIRWSVDGRALTYIDTRAGVSNIWSQSINGGPPVQLTDFKSDRIFSFDWSHDGKQLACSRGAEVSDVVLITDLKKSPK